MGKKDEKGGNVTVKVPKGTKDWEGKDMVIREKIFSTITDVFKRYGGVTIDTPVFELREILTGKYGEDSKLIYNLEDQGGEICSLRYDLTVPFARWLAMNNVQAIKRYAIAKVYRRDQPAMTKGRMREFYQCDFDIAGVYDEMIPDSECISLICDIFNSLGWEGNTPSSSTTARSSTASSSAVDKLDKSPWEEVRREMTDDKGLDPAVADKIGTYVVHKGQEDLLRKLQSDEALMANESAKQGLAEMETLFSYLKAKDIMGPVSFDMSLARGLDYYTGVIYEVITEGSAPQTNEGQKVQQKAKKETKSKNNPNVDGDEDRSNDPSVGVGSIAAGGRYDKLVGMFSGKGDIPCVGISFGVERIFSITKARMEAEGAAKAVRLNDVDAYVMAFGGKGFEGLLEERMKVAQRLRQAGIKADYLMKKKPKLPAQFKAAETSGVPLRSFWVKIKEMGLEEGHPEKEGVQVELDNLVEEMRARIEKSKAKGVEALEGKMNAATLDEAASQAPKTA
ncbi:Cytoplasmic and mitochondrial histidine tRNA synthetase [Taxawa tesnikishii (nom. ined.)]|nr:Cytoplasmic and mitochondrial histidine tRNA synthetase [Dothideales sp. JES 119]